ncbi:MAG: DUF481 domain-containing protein [Mariprofundus sp.]
MKAIITLLLTLCMAIPAIAADVEEAKAPDNWSNSSEIGALQTSGNTQTLTLNAKTKLSHHGEARRDTFEASAYSSADRQQSTAEKYTASLQNDFKVSDSNYLFTRLGFESDRFSGFRRRTAETIGYGRDLIITEGFKWNAELGGGMRQSKLVNRTSTSEAIIRGATLAEWQIAESVKFSEQLSSEGGKSGWASKSVTSLKQKVNAHLSSNISLALTHNSNVPTGTKKLDIETAITMVVDF